MYDMGIRVVHITIKMLPLPASDNILLMSWTRYSSVMFLHIFILFRYDSVMNIDYELIKSLII